MRGVSVVANVGVSLQQTAPLEHLFVDRTAEACIYDLPTLHKLICFPFHPELFLHCSFGCKRHKSFGMCAQVMHGYECLRICKNTLECCSFECAACRNLPESSCRYRGSSVHTEVRVHSLHVSLGCRKYECSICPITHWTDVFAFVEGHPQGEGFLPFFCCSMQLSLAGSRRLLLEPVHASISSDLGL